QGNWIGIFVGGILMSGAMYSAANAVWTSFYSDMFPVSVSATALAPGSQIGFALSFGFVPVIATLLSGQQQTGWLLPALFATVVCLVVAGAAMTAKETHAATLAEIDDMHTTPQERAALEVTK